MACLAALCIVLPGRIAFGGKQLRWPTLAEVIGTEEAYPHPLPEEEGSITAPDTIAPSSQHIARKSAVFFSIR